LTATRHKTAKPSIRLQVGQAIYSSAHNARKQGYQLLAASPCVSAQEAKALSAWCPSHGALHSDADRSRSINFHELPGGRYCLSRTTFAGQEYSDRPGERVHTHCLIVPTQLLKNFSNNPFALLEACKAKGVFDESIPTSEQNGSPRRGGQWHQLEPLPLAGRASTCEINAVGALLNVIDIDSLAILLDQFLRHPQLALQAGPLTETLFRGLINCLPVGCRREISFSTGLKHSAQRPCRLIATWGDQAQRRRLERLGVRVVAPFAQSAAGARPFSGWPRQVSRCVKREGVLGLAKLLDQARPTLRLDELAESGIPAPQGGGEIDPVAHPLASGKGGEGNLEQLEALDDAVYDAIAGHADALEQLQRLWPRLSSEIDPEVLEQSREQYLIYALSVWDKFQSTGENPRLAASALDVIHLLLEESGGPQAHWPPPVDPDMKGNA